MIIQQLTSIRRRKGWNKREQKENILCINMQKKRMIILRFGRVFIFYFLKVF